MIIREFNLLDPLNRYKEEEVEKRFVEIFKSVRNPVIKIGISGTQNYVSFKQKGGIVEYRLISNWNECLKMKCDLMEAENDK